jgi:hypothetical protein
MWEKITAKYGIDINMFEDVIGTAWYFYFRIYVI